MHDRILEMLYTYSKKYKIFLIVFTNAIVDPWAMVIHFPYTATTNTIVSEKIQYTNNRQTQQLSLIYLTTYSYLPKKYDNKNDGNVKIIITD